MRLRAGLFLADFLALDFLAADVFMAADAFLAGGFFLLARRCGFLRTFFAVGFLTVLRVVGLAAFLAGFLRAPFLGAAFLGTALRAVFLADVLRAAGLGASFFFAALLFAAGFFLVTAISMLLSSVQAPGWMDAAALRRTSEPAAPLPLASNDAQRWTKTVDAPAR
jgi:hypothetical protein